MRTKKDLLAEIRILESVCSNKDLVIESYKNEVAYLKKKLEEKDAAIKESLYTVKNQQSLIRGL